MSRNAADRSLVETNDIFWPKNLKEFWISFPSKRKEDKNEFKECRLFLGKEP